VNSASGVDQMACSIAARAGVAHVVNLEGGLLAWQTEVEPTLVVASA
jgi:rhodanese-related sulfurtransferase